MTDYILTYYQMIKDGRVTVGKWVRLVYEYVIDGLSEKKFTYDAKKAQAAIDWIEAHCFHTEGKLAPNPLILELWQKAFLSCIFGLVDDDGNPHFREIVLIIARKNGKSLLASAIARYIWLNGGYGARVYNVAPKLDQADIIYNNIWTMTTLDPEWQEKERKRKERDPHGRRINEDDPTMERHRMTDLFYPATSSTVKKLAFTAKRLDGFNPSLSLLDEFAAYDPPDKGLKVYEAMQSGMIGRDDSLLISLSTANYISEGLYDELMKRSTRVLLGESKEKRLLPFLYMIDDIEKWNDINELKKSNPNLGVSVSVDYLLEGVAAAENSLPRRAEFITKQCNIKQNSSTAWLPSKLVTDAKGEHLNLEDFRGSYCVGGIDLSQTRDLTCAVIVIEKEGELYVFARFWLPAEKIDEAIQRDGIPYNAFIQRGILFPSGDNYIDYHDCENWFMELVRDYEILPLQIGYDRYCAQYLVNDMKAEGYHLDDIFQGENLYGVIQETQGLLEDRRIHIGDNDLLAMHLLDSAIKMSTERGRGKLVKVNSRVHIDGTAALLDALTVRQKWYGEIGDRLANR